MRSAQPLEREVGMAHYVSDTEGIGGELRTEPEDFRVRELEQFDTYSLDEPSETYPHLVIRATLRRWDTNDFAKELSNRLGISRERVSWAGTKDKHAVTTQLFSVDGIEAADLPDIGGVDYEVVGRAGRSILFGDLAGNAFGVTVRNTTEPERVDAIAAELSAFSDLDDDQIGLPNYFGHQRFGSRRPVTHEVGLDIVRGNWRDAVLTYVGNPSEREPEATQEARALVDETEDWKRALDQYPRHLGYERAMLHRLVEGDDDPEDFRAALETAPTNLQQLFVNAAQSYAFNRMLSERLERGLPFAEPVAGDVVCFADSDAPDGLALPDQDRTQRVTEARLASVKRHCERGRAFVTAPLVGTETEFAGGEPGDIEREVLADLGLDPSDFDLPGEFDSTGTRRAILIQTALDVDREPVTLSFRLPRGSYATVALREFMKVDPARL
jgi:tRNA pseudouridine13 synthase